MKHTEFEKLVKRFEGSLSLSEERETAEHLGECADCRVLAQKLEAFFHYAADGQTARVSQADTARLLNIFQPQSARKISARGESFVERLVASLVFDDWQTALNERFVPTGADTRHLLYRAGELEIDMRFEFDGGGGGGGKCRVSGQIFPDCGERASAEIFSETASETVFLNEYCEFVFPPVAEGVYHFRFNLAGKTIEIEDISLLS